MFNILRFIVIIVVAMIVFGWGVVAGQTSPSYKSRRGADVTRVRLKSMPEVPARKAYSRSKQSGGADSFAAAPEFSQPDFGPLPKLNWMRIPAVHPTQHRTRWSFPRSAIRNFFAGTEARSNNNIEIHVDTSFGYPAAPPVDLATSVPSNRETGSMTVSINSATVNHQLLAQRIEDHNLSVRAIEDRLNSRNGWNLTGLEAVVSQIDSMIREQEMCLLYWEILPPRQQRRLGEVMSLSAGLEKLRQRIFETNVATDVDASLVSQLSERQTKARLDSLNELAETWMRKIR